MCPTKLVRMRSPVRIWLSAPKKQSPRRGGCFFRVGRFRAGDLTRGARYNKRAAKPSASSNLAISSKKTAPQQGRCLFAFEVGIRTGDLKREAFYNKTNSIAVRCCSPVRIWLSRRRKLHIACDDFFAPHQKSSRARSAAPPFKIKTRTVAARLVANFGAPLCRVLILSGTRGTLFCCAQGKRLYSA